MQDRILGISLLLAVGIGISLACKASGLIGGFFGVFVGIFVGYALIVALSHLFCLLLPKLGIGDNPRTGEERVH